MSTHSDPAAFPWGAVGQTTWGALRSREDGEGAVREVESGVEYVLGTATELPFPLWSKLSERQYELYLGEDEPSAVRSLGKLRESLHKRTRYHGDERDLNDLDETFQSLLRCVAALHANGFAAGLLQPNNILIPVRPTVEGEKMPLVLPDVGFVLFRGALPDWLQAQADSPWTGLWEYSPERMNAWALDRGRHPKLARKFADSVEKPKSPGLDVATDLKTVARLITWVLTPDARLPRKGKIKVPLREPDGWARADVWGVLSDVMNGAITDAEVFRRALEQDQTYRPSQQFIEQNIAPPPPRVPPWKRLAPVLSVLVLVTLLAVGYKSIINRPPPGPPNELCLDCPATSKVYPLLSDFLKADHDAEKELAVLRQMYKADVLDRGEGVASVERTCREKILNIALGRLESRGEMFPERIRDKGVTESRARKEAGSLKQQFESLYELKAGRSPTPEDYDPWLKRLYNLGYVSAP